MTGYAFQQHGIIDDIPFGGLKRGYVFFLASLASMLRSIVLLKRNQIRYAYGHVVLPIVLPHIDRSVGHHVKGQCIINTVYIDVLSPRSERLIM